MIIPSLLIVSWTLWAGLAGSLLYALISMVVERLHRAEKGSILSLVIPAVGLLFSIATGFLLYWLGEQQSVTGLIVTTLLLAWLLIPLVTRPLIAAVKDWKSARGKTSPGNFAG